MADSREAQPLDVEELLKELTFKIDRVKTLYEQYFMGIEKIEPLTPRKEVQRVMLQLQQTYIRNTGVRFKFNTLLQKWNIYITYWNRILRDIEAGTYVRHLAKAARAAAREGKELPEELARAHKRPPSGAFPTQPPETGATPSKAFLDTDSDEHALEVMRLPSRADLSTLDEQTEPGLERVPRQRATTPVPSPPPIPPAAARPPSLPGTKPAIPGMSVEELRALHQKYLAARKQAGEHTNVSYEALVSSLQKSVGKLLEQPAYKGVRFDIGTQNGKVVLKATPIKK